MLCVVIKGPCLQDVCRQIEEACPLADLLELRLDLCSLTWEEIARVRVRSPLPLIFTLRSADHGGYSGLSQHDRQTVLQRLAQLRPEYLDIEHPTDLPPPNVQCILSYHEFEGTPADIQGLYDSMRKTPAPLYKIALKATDTLDALRLLCWDKPPDCIAISMGIPGQISRALSGFINNPITYAALEEDPASETGQLSVHTLMTYKTTPQTALYGLIGDPVTLSISDITHNAHFRAEKLDAVYVKMQVPPAQLKTFLQRAKQLPFQGLSITMPLKEVVVPLLDQIDTEAAHIGAVNTLVLHQGKWIGYNTDGKGALNAIERKLLVRGKRLVILGAGGAAKAIAYEAHQRGAVITILNRHVARAEEVAATCQGTALGLDQMHTCYDILINCTPSDRPIDPQYLRSQALIMDIRTRPKETPFLQAALQKGCSVVYGYEMFIAQALLQFALWKLPLSLHRERLEQTAVEALNTTKSSGSSGS